MDLRRSRWVLGVVLASFALLGTPAGADEPNFTEEQKIDFMQHAKVIASKPEKKGKSNASHLTLSDGKVTHDASFQPIDDAEGCPQQEIGDDRPREPGDFTKTAIRSVIRLTDLFVSLVQ